VQTVVGRPVPGQIVIMKRIVLSFLFVLLAALPASAKEHIVKVVSDYDNLRMYFEPKSLTVSPGDTVTWVNQAAEMHNMLTFPDGFPEGAQGFVSPYLKKKGERWSFTFEVAGSYEYHCLPHLPMGMHGVVIVDHPSKAEDFHKPTPKEVAAYRKRMLEFFDDDEYKFRAKAWQHME